MIRKTFLLFLAVSPLAACAAAGAASRPADISASHATGESAAPGGACNPTAKPNQVTPFVADWTDGERSSLESAMKKGVEAGREAFLAGRMPRKFYTASPSSPTTGLIGS